ncbi:hypothetical protein AGABI1DRAFT_109320 [Agaricus bisporus var. burnettii JB137-S8]|uniref:Uncharacterized protein n=1 Tax=Agaricus bisporus var. burnettii (strain JB137-S8 / ATCC MYA-4627 / FGSC 10392) TaxID=597362 RepID=K5WJT9_AGABU|nr:uncharacterized protein AGABI1DRAFT_109320 [Agaricus bisporus var. burnettii JB137-S8]EKM75561.1 hypothetical protein AGABI1DRAFT_109320 [Agaricus bisporus var. burnettii JB137-S8]
MLSLLSVPPALCFSVPLVVLVLALRTLALHQHRQFLLLSALALLSFALLASVAGILGLKASAGLFTFSKVQLIVDNIIYAELGVSVIYLAVKHNNPAPWLPRSRYIKPYTGLLCFFLFCATTIGLATPFVLAIPPLFPPLIFLIFTLSTLPLLVHLIYIHCYPPNPSPSPRSNKKPSKLSKPRKKLVNPSVTVPGPTSLPRLTMPCKNTTAITVLIPPPLPSPASSSASFPETDQSHKQLSHFKHPSDAEDPSPIEGSAYAAAKLHEESDLGHNTNYVERMDTDLEANPRFSRLTPATAPSALAITLRQRTMRLRMRSRSILITLLISQTFAILSGTLLLVLGISDDAITASTSLLRIIETVFIVLCVSGFTFAFYLHGLPLDNSLSPPQSLAAPGSITISVAQRQDHDDIAPGIIYHTDGGDRAVAEGDMIPHFVVDGGDYPETSSLKPITDPVINVDKGKYGLGIDRIFNSAKSRFCQQDIFSHPRSDGHFGSASSSFTSPRPKRPPILVFDQVQYDDDEKFEDEGIELPVLATAQLPSPPTTPRAKGVDQPWQDGCHYPYNHHHLQERDSYFDREEVRVGVMRPGIKVNVIREFEEREKYQEAVADVVDTAASEPGCTSSSGSGDTVPASSISRSPRIWFSQYTFSPTSSKSPAITNNGPTSPSAKSLTLSPKSSTFSIFRSSTNPGSPKSAWKRAQRIKAKLRRPLTLHHSATASSPNVTSLDFAAAASHKFVHRKAGSASKIAEWYPFTSKNKQGKREDNDRDTYWKGEEGRDSGGIEMADFVDLTDPFASPTPGFALPKWIDNGTAGSSSDVGHQRAMERTSMSEGRSELTSVGSAKGKGREWDTTGSGGRENEKVGGVMLTSKTTMWGRVPVVIGNEAGYDRDVNVMDFPGMLRMERRGKGSRKRQTSGKERRVGGRGVKRPDSPMPVPTTPSFTHSRSMSIDRMVDVLEDIMDAPGHVGLGLGSSLKRKPEHMRRKGSRQSLRSVQDGSTTLKPFVPATPNLPSSYFSIPTPSLPNKDIEPDRFGDDNVNGRLSRWEKGKNRERTRNGSPIPIGMRSRLQTSLRRKGSPVPILFRSPSGYSHGGGASMDGRHMKEFGRIPSSSSPTSTKALERETMRSRTAERRKVGGDHVLKRYLEDESSVDVELNLEEILLAQKLLRRLDSVYHCDDYDEREDETGR